MLNFNEGRALFAKRVQPEPAKIPCVDDRGKLHIFLQEKWGFIDQAGAVVIPAHFDAAGNFSEGLAAVGFDTDQTEFNCTDCVPRRVWGFVDAMGKLVVPARYRAASSFAGGLAAVENHEGKWGYIDAKGNLTIPFSFDSADNFNEGLAAAAIGNKFGYIDEKGRFVIRPAFATAGKFSGGLAAVRSGGKTDSMILGPAGGTWMFVGKDGKTRIRLPKGTDSLGKFSEGLAAVYVRGHCGYVSASGRMVVALVFSYCEDFSDGLADVRGDGRWKYIDQQGRVVLTVPYFGVRPFKNGRAGVQVGPVGPAQKFGYIDKSGKEIWKPEPAI